MFAMSGFLGQCMENLLLDQNFWLNSLDQEDAGIEISITEETINLMYRAILMQEGAFRIGHVTEISTLNHSCLRYSIW